MMVFTCILSAACLLLAVKSIQIGVVYVMIFGIMSVLDLFIAYLYYSSKMKAVKETYIEGMNKFMEEKKDEIEKCVSNMQK